MLTATNGEEALRVSAEQPDEIHLLLTDVVMPQISEPELAKRIRHLRPDVRILCMSGNMDHAMVRPGILDAGTNYIGKPFSRNDLRRKVRYLLSGLPDPGPG